MCSSVSRFLIFSTIRTLVSQGMSLAVRVSVEIADARFPTGESGSSRQVQFGIKLVF